MSVISCVFNIKILWKWQSLTKKFSDFEFCCFDYMFSWILQCTAELNECPDYIAFIPIALQPSMRRMSQSSLRMCITTSEWRKKEAGATLVWEWLREWEERKKNLFSTIKGAFGEQTPCCKSSTSWIILSSNYHADVHLHVSHSVFSLPYIVIFGQCVYTN